MNRVMAQLAIKGHETRGNEVIEILEMLGGKNKQGYNGENNFLWHYINERNDISIFTHTFDLNEFIFFTLKEFLEKFPYKVGDKVDLNGIGVEITGMYWLDNTINYEGKSIKLGSEYDCLSVQDLKPLQYINDLQPYKEETMEDKPDLLQQLKEYFDNTPREVVEKEWHEYDKYNEIGPTVNEYLEYVSSIRQPQYPKTYKECFNICFGNHHPVVQVVGLDGLGNNKSLFERFIKLKICRDAYWKIAGEQMGLGKPWKPTWNGSESCYCIFCDNGEILEDEVSYGNTILAFPTQEIRDAFKENFDSDIEFCKEFL